MESTIKIYSIPIPIFQPVYLPFTLKESLEMSAFLFDKTSGYTSGYSFNHTK